LLFQAVDRVAHRNASRKRRRLGIFRTDDAFLDGQFESLRRVLKHID